jgi:hypothetical protein
MLPLYLSEVEVFCGVVIGYQPAGMVVGMGKDWTPSLPLSICNNPSCIPYSFPPTNSITILSHFLLAVHLPHWLGDVLVCDVSYILVSEWSSLYCTVMKYSYLYLKII